MDGFLLRGRATPTPRQLDEVGVTVDSLREVTTAEFLGAVTARTHDVIVLACVGGAVQAMVHGVRHATAQSGGRRPVVVTGYVGVVYEKLTDGLLLRHGADVVLANSPYDAERFRSVYEGVGADAGSVVECALPFLGPTGGSPVAEGGGRSVDGGRSGEGRRSGEGGAFTVVFAVQPSVPTSRADRAYLLRRAVGHARRHPEREVLIKLRSKPGEHTTHVEEEPYQKLVRKLPGDRDRAGGASAGGGGEGGVRGALPSNCRLVYGNMGAILDRARTTGGMLVTVSSTAALESLHRRVPTAVLTDLGVRETLGNHYFTGSGCLASWDQLDDGLLPEADEEWALRQGVRGRAGFAAARSHVAALTASAHRGGLPPLAPYYTARTSPGYQPAVLRRYGLDATGAPLDTATGEGAGPGLVRRAMREAARGAYRHGVQRVAPLIRKAGEL